MTLLRVPALLLAQVRKVIEARPIPRPLTFAPIVGLRFGFLLDGGFSRERVEGVALRVFAGELVGLRLRVVVVLDAVHIIRIWGVGMDGKEFLCGYGMTHTEDQFDLSAAIRMHITSEVTRKHFAVKVEA